MAGSDKRKQSLYFPTEMLREIQEEAARQDRSLSWIVQKAWKTARKSVMAFPGVDDVENAINAPSTPAAPANPGDGSSSNGS